MGGGSAETSPGPRYNACVFDFDGTLIDTMGHFADVAAGVLERYFGLDPREGRHRYLETSGLPFHLQLEQLFPGHAANAAAAEFEGLKMAGVDAGWFYPETKGVLATLRRAGVKVAICSNNFAANIEPLLREAEIEADLVLGYRPGFHKGRPHFDHLRRSWGLARDQLLYVGDSVKDGHWARAYGVAFVARTGAASRSRFQREFPNGIIIDDLHEVLALVLPGEGNP